MSEPLPSIYFAYGANLNRNHMGLWCPNSSPLEPAVLPDHRLVFRFWADLLPAPGHQLPGALYRLGQGDLQWLDEYEDCPRLYEHVAIHVVTARHHRVEAMTYRARPGHPFAPPAAEYLATVRQGYLDWALDPADLPG